MLQEGENRDAITVGVVKRPERGGLGRLSNELQRETHSQLRIDSTLEENVQKKTVCCPAETPSVLCLTNKKRHLWLDVMQRIF